MKLDLCSTAALIAQPHLDLARFPLTAHHLTSGYAVREHAAKSSSDNSFQCFELLHSALAYSCHTTSQSSMKDLDEEALRPHLVSKLQPLSEAEPAMLADYVIALLKNDASRDELYTMCERELSDFLEGNTKVGLRRILSQTYVLCRF
jgi:hypothetical protein